MCKSTPAIGSTRRRLGLPLFALGLVQTLALGVTGCRTTSDNQIDLLERELRVQEDYIYELEGYVVDYSEKLRDCRGCSPSQPAVYSEEVYPPKSTSKSTAQPKRRRADKERSIVEKDTEQDINDGNEDLPLPDQDQPAPEFDPQDLEVPDIEMQLDDPLTGGPLTEINEDGPAQQLSAVELDYKPAGGKVMMIPDPVDFDDSIEALASETEFEGEFADEGDEFANDHFEDELVEQTSALVKREVERLEVAQLFRGPADDDSPLNLLTVVEALDANNEPVDLDGEVSLMVMTPDETGKPRRIKRWNFTPAETTSSWQSSDLGDGLHLELPLEKTELPNSPVELWVRLVTADGKKVLTKLPFRSGELVALDDEAPQPIASSTTLAAETSTSSSINPLRSATSSISSDKQLKLANSKPTNQPSGWRSSMQRTGRTSEGFATSSATATGWTKQAPGRVQSLVKQTALQPSSTASKSTVQTTNKPIWTAGRPNTATTTNYGTR